MPSPTLPALNPLAHELETYAAHKDELVGEALGKWALIHEDRVIGTFDTQMDAIRAGYRECGNVPFLAKQIVELETPLHLTSSFLGT